MARVTCWGEKEPLKGEGVRMLEGNLRAHSGKGMGYGDFRKGVLQGKYYSGSPEKQWEHQDVTKDTSPVGLLSHEVAWPAGSQTDPAR